MGQISGFSNLRLLSAIPVNRVIELNDSNVIVPQSIQIKNQQFLPIINYRYDQYSKRIYFNSDFNELLWVTYRVYPFNLQLSNQTPHFVVDSVRKKIYTRNMYTEPNTINLLDLDGLEYSGSFYRGFTFGNTQTLALNSGFNLGISGRMNNGIEIVAAISDENIPVQPEGNTAQINEFDKIFIQVKKDNHRITVGDIDIEQTPTSYFLNFTRKLQGINYQTKLALGDSSILQLEATAALTRGQFARNILTAQENNQGPYKLRGANNELFLIVLSRTERVFINGALLERGFDKDYVIDYNLGEITFTNKRMITRDLRIVVEFQYADKNYFRSTLYGNMMWEHKGISFFGNVFMEQDNKNQPLNYTLDDKKINVLKQAGDEESKAVVSNFGLVAADPTKVLYALKDTVVNGVPYDTVFYWSTSKDSFLYSVNFSFVGEQKGNYKVLSASANGRVYQWVAPQNGIPVGDYEPIQVLVSPKSDHIYSFGTKIDAVKNIQINTEIALSNKDKNTFSDIDDADNIGLSAKVNVKFNGNRLTAGLGHEWVGRKFNFIQRFRGLEFSRDWNTESLALESGDEHLLKAEIAMLGKLETRFTSNAFIKDSLYKGFEQELATNWKIKKTTMRSMTRFLSAYHQWYTTYFLRPRLSLQLPFLNAKQLQSEIGLFHEWKRTQYHNTDTLDKQSFFWQNYYIKLFRTDSSLRALSFEYRYWIEKRPSGAAFDRANILSHTFSLNGRTKFKAIESIDYGINYRNFWNKDSLAFAKELAHYYLGKINMKVNLWNQFLKYNIIYELGAGREQRTQYTFVKAPNGYGSYAWKDINNNGFFDLDEAFISQFNFENRYIKIMLNTPEFVSTNDVVMRNLLNLQFKNLLKNKKHLLARFNNVLNMDINRKVVLSKNLSFADYLNPGILSNVVSSNLYIKNQFSFNKENQIWGMDYDFALVANKNLLSNGIEGRNVKKHLLNARIQITPQYNIKLNYENVQTTSMHEFFKDRNYSYVSNGFGTKWSFMHQSIFRVELNYDYKFFSNAGKQFNLVHEAGLQARYSKDEKGMMETRLSYLDINYVENVKNEQVEFSMLSGLSRGGNIIWSINFERKLTDILNLNIIYQGRKNLLQTNFVHALSAEIRAFF
jgi:hypothetical protein